VAQPHQVAPVAIYLIGCAVALAACRSPAMCRTSRSRCCCWGDAVHGAADAPGLKPDPKHLQGTFYGSICMGLMLMTGVSGPLMDTFFLGGKFDRAASWRPRPPVRWPVIREADLFGGIIDQAATLDPALAGSLSPRR